MLLWHIPSSSSNTAKDLLKFGNLIKGNSNFELGTAICYVNVENYFLTIINHIAVPSTKLELLLNMHNLEQKLVH